jgi:adenylate cyclase
VVAGVELADEVAEPVFEFEPPAIGSPVVDDEDAQVLEGALEHAAASIPGRAGRRKLVERIGAVGDPEAIHLPKHVVERARGYGARSRSFPDRHRHRRRVYARPMAIDCRPKRAGVSWSAVAETQPTLFEDLIADAKLYRLRRFMRLVPRAPRCKMCNVPFAGPGRVFKLAGYGRSRKNPDMCTACFEKAPVGGGEGEIGVLFADVRGFTGLAESRSPEALSELLVPFYRASREILLRHDAVIDKLVGDEVMALFIPVFMRGDAIEEMVEGAVELLQRTADAGLPVGAGCDFGTAFVGNVGQEDLKDFTALGDVVNTASRLQAQAEAGQLIVSKRVFESVAGRFPGSARVDLDLKGKTAPVAAHRIEVTS